MANPLLVVFVHGWSVTSTDTYGELPARLCARPHLSEYLVLQVAGPRRVGPTHADP